MTTLATPPGNTWLTSARKLLLKKAAVTGGIAFLSVFIPGILKLLDEVQSGTGQPDFSTTFWFSLIAGALGAGLRAALALSPINLTPTDALNSLGKDAPSEVVVSTEAPPTAPAPPAST